MADSVRRILEEMVPELDALEQVGYFSKAEVRSIAQRRQDYEYALQRRLPDKSDFLRSIAFEVSLERLRALRKQERNITASRKKTTLTDYCIIRRTHKLYERMLRKFKGDLALWSDWIQFCGSCRSSKQMSKVLTRMMQLFPTEAAVWVHAAAWELEHNHNATVARSLMQTGIRMCSGDARLWVEYFRMELLYAARLVARREVLFKGAVDAMSGVDTIDPDGNMQVAQADADVDDATRALLSGGVAKVVYVNAMESLGGNVDGVGVGLDFLRVLRPLPILEREKLEDWIVQDVMTRCMRLHMDEQEGPSATTGGVGAIGRIVAGLGNILFQRSRDDGLPFQEAVEGALGIFDAFEGTVLTGLLEAKVTLLGGMFEEAVQGGEDADTLAYILNACLETGQEALVVDGKEAPSSAIVLAMSRAKQRLGQFMEWSLAYLSRINASDVVTERIYASTLATLMSSEHGGEDAHQQEYQRFIDRESGKGLRHPQAWLAMIASCSQDPNCLVALGEVYVQDQLAAVTAAADSVNGVVASCLVNSLLLNVGIEAARSFYRDVLKGPLPGARFIVDVAKMEQGLGVAGRDVERIRRVFDAGAHVYGSAAVDLWLEYYAFERSLGSRASKADAVHWQAISSLDDADAFAAQNIVC